MADSYNVKKITELAAKSASDDTDLYVVGNQGTATMRKISFATIAAAVRDKLTSLTFPSLNTSNKTLPGAINELNSKAISYVDVSGTTGTSLYGSYYYVNIAIPVAARNGFINASILTSENYRYAVVQRLSDTQIRVYCDQSEKSVSVRIAYQ